MEKDELMTRDIPVPYGLNSHQLEFLKIALQIAYNRGYNEALKEQINAGN